MINNVKGFRLFICLLLYVKVLYCKLPTCSSNYQISYVRSGQYLNCNLRGGGQEKSSENILKGLQLFPNTSGIQLVYDGRKT